MIDQAESLRKRMLQTKAARKTAAVAMASPAAHPAADSVTYEEVPVTYEDAPTETEAVPFTPDAEMRTEDQVLTQVLEILEEVPDEPEVKKISDLKEKTGFVKIYAVVSGKGGVGKTNVSVNLSIAMAKLGKKVLLMDADIGMTNADIIMGIHYENDLFDYLEGRVGIEEIIYEGPLGVKVISGGAGLLEMNALSGEDQEALISDLIDLGGFDVMIIDNGAGITKETLSFITFAHEVILVTTPEPTAITDAYRVLKTISHYSLKTSVKLIINKVPSSEAGKEAFDKLESTAKAFLSLAIENCGYIFDDSRVEKAIMKQEPVVLSYPNALSSGNIHTIAGIILEEKVFINNISTIKQLGNRFMKIFGT